MVDQTFSWQTIETAPLDGTEVDLFGFIDYDMTEVRLHSCEYKDGKWYYFTCGEMYPCDGELSFTPTHWIKIDNPV